MKITAQELHQKSIQNQITHRKTWEQLSEDQKFTFEAYAEWANELIAEKSKMALPIDEIKVKDCVMGCKTCYRTKRVDLHWCQTNGFPVCCHESMTINYK